MSANEVHPYNFPASQANDFERKGHPGKFLKSITCTTGTTHFTGSNYGVGGVVVSSGATGTFYFSGGGTLPIDGLADSKRILDFSLSSVTVTAGTVYALIKNQISK
jgi:hypothetical protein